ncbi:MAG: UTP--glucose-1-phosphate uridylyltransferase GalU [Patescibacteria group bacterium]|nr:UTP--glucose-1-phosphate uridylyltransferase GalU [Patescibacteria group bacterium]
MIRKAIIPVAGLGTRFLPATKAQPKEMLPIIDKPIIQYVVEEAVNSGITEIIFITGRNKRAIEDHFDYAPEIESRLISKNNHEVFKTIRSISEMANFTYVRQKEPLGDGHALLCASHLVNDEPVAVLFGDDIIDSKIPCLKQMIKIFERYEDPVIAIEEVKREEIKNYGIVDGIKISDRIFEIRDIVEKPQPNEAPSRLGIVGRYILKPNVFEELKKISPGKDGEIRLANALKSLLKSHSVYGYKFNGQRYDCGSKIGYLKATVNFALKHDEVRNEFRKFLKEIS